MESGEGWCNLPVVKKAPPPVGAVSFFPRLVDCFSNFRESLGTARGKSGNVGIQHRSAQAPRGSCQDSARHSSRCNLPFTFALAAEDNGQRILRHQPDQSNRQPP